MNYVKKLGYHLTRSYNLAAIGIGGIATYLYFSGKVEIAELVAMVGLFSYLWLRND